MAAPSGTVWGSIVDGSSSGRKGRIGVYTDVSSNNTQTTVNVQVWFWTIYSCSDGSNNFYYDVGTGVSSASTLIGTVDISHTVATGEGWNTANQTRLINKTYTYNRGTSDVTYKVYAKFNGIDMIPSGTMYANTSYTVPKLASYTVSYNANGGTGAPSSQTKWYGKTLTLSGTKPSRSGYTFQGWATSSGGSVSYAAGATYTANAGVTLYAVWKAITYIVAYNANGGSGAPSSQTKTHGVSLTLSGTKPTRTNYTFKGWATSASATAATYAAGGTYTANQNTTLYAVWGLAYTKPAIKNISVSRCNSSGSITDKGTYALVKFSWSTSYSVSKITIEWESSAGSSSTTVSASGTSGSVNKVVGGSLSTELAYTVRITVSDSGGSWTVSRNLTGDLFVFDALSGGKGVAFGKAAELSGYMDIAFKTRHRDNIILDNSYSICGIDPNGDMFSVVQPQNENGNFVLGWDNYDKKSGNTNVYGYDVNIGVSNISSPGYYRPYCRQGDSITLNLHTAGFVTNSGKDVHFFIPFAVPIVGSPTVTLASGNGFMLRQGTKYTHGSSASTYVFPDSYTVSNRYMFNGLSITASFTDTTNVTNNDAIGIVWHGTITFS